MIVTLCKLALPSFSLADAILRKWKNAEGQLSFITTVMSAPPEVYSFPSSPELLELLEQQQVNSITPGLVQSLTSLPLVSTLLRLSMESMAYQGKIYEILQNGVKQCPKVLFLGLSLISPPVSVYLPFIVS